MSRSRRIGDGADQQSEAPQMDGSEVGTSEEQVSGEVADNKVEPSVDSNQEAAAAEGGLEHTEARQTPDDFKPYCPVHNCSMIAQTSRKTATVYKCRVSNCDATEVRMRPIHPIPKDPIVCPKCKSFGDEIACEVIPTRTNETQLLMQCPGCKWEVRVQRPTAAKIVSRIHRQAEANSRLDFSRSTF